MMDIHVERGRAWAVLASGDLAAARSILWEAVDLANTWGQLASASAALHDLIRLGDTHAAVRRLEELADLVDGELMVARLALGRALHSGDPVLAESAADRFEACGAFLYAAEAASIEQRLAADSRLHRRATAAAARAQRLARHCDLRSRRPPRATRRRPQQLRRAAGVCRLRRRSCSAALATASKASRRGGCRSS